MNKVTKLTLRGLVAFACAISVGIIHDYKVNQDKLITALEYRTDVLRITNSAIIKAIVDSKINVAKSLIAPHVVKLIIENHVNHKMAVATGFYVNYNHKILLVTNRHVCSQDDGLTTIYSNEKPLVVLAISNEHDLCLIKADRKSGLYLSNKDVENNDKVILVGHPNGLPLTIREGYKMGSFETVFPWVSNQRIPFTLISSITYRGNSGSPVTNEYGEVIGVLFAGNPESITEGFVVPLKNLKQFLSKNYRL